MHGSPAWTAQLRCPGSLTACGKGTCQRICAQVQCALRLQISQLHQPRCTCKVGPADITHFLKSAMYRPAWRMSQTGVRSASAFGVSMQEAGVPSDVHPSLRVHCASNRLPSPLATRNNKGSAPAWQLTTGRCTVLDAPCRALRLAVCCALDWLPTDCCI